MVNRTHLEADIGGLTMEAELKKIHGSFTLKEKMKGEAEPELFHSGQRKWISVLCEIYIIIISGHFF